MPVRLGEGLPVPSARPEPGVSGDDRRHEEVLAALAMLREAVLALAERRDPPPIVRVDGPDIAELVATVDGLRVLVDRPPLHEPVVYPSAAEIADAVSSSWQGDAASVALLEQLTEQVRRLNTKFKAAAASGGGGTASAVGIRNASKTDINPATEETLLAVLAASGGGIQYTEGDIDASVTGTAVMWEDAADTLRVASATKPLPVAQQNQLVPFVYDFIDLGYTGDDLTTVVYKAGGSAGTTVATLTLAYTGGKLDTVTRS